MRLGTETGGFEMKYATSQRIKLSYMFHVIIKHNQFNWTRLTRLTLTA